MLLDYFARLQALRYEANLASRNVPGDVGGAKAPGDAGGVRTRDPTPPRRAAWDLRPGCVPQLLNAAAHAIEREMAWLAHEAPEKLPAEWLGPGAVGRGAGERRGAVGAWGLGGAKPRAGNKGTKTGNTTTSHKKGAVDHAGSASGPEDTGRLLRVRATVMDYETHPAWLNLPLFEEGHGGLVSLNRMSGGAYVVAYYGVV